MKCPCGPGSGIRAWCSTQPTRFSDSALPYLQLEGDCGVIVNPRVPRKPKDNNQVFWYKMTELLVLLPRYEYSYCIAEKAVTSVQSPAEVYKGWTIAD